MPLFCLTLAYCLAEILPSLPANAKVSGKNYWASKLQNYCDVEGMPEVNGIALKVKKYKEYTFQQCEEIIAAQHLIKFRLKQRRPVVSSARANTGNDVDFDVNPLQTALQRDEQPRSDTAGNESDITEDEADTPEDGNRTAHVPIAHGASEVEAGFAQTAHPPTMGRRLALGPINGRNLRHNVISSIENVQTEDLDHENIQQQHPKPRSGQRTVKRARHG